VQATWRSGLPRNPNITCSPENTLPTSTGGLGALPIGAVQKILSTWTYSAAHWAVSCKPTRAIIGEAGPEVVLPLSGNTTSFSATTINITVNANADPREIAAAVERVIEGRNRRAAVV